MDKYEWGVIYFGDSASDLHRGPMTEAEARAWIEKSAGLGISASQFELVKRKVENWKRA